VGVVGQPKRFTRIREDFLEAFYHDSIGGVDGLVAWATEDPRNRETFYRMICQLLPKELNLTGREGGPIELTDPERITKLQFVIATLERAVKKEIQVEPEPLLVEVPRERVETENRPGQDRVGNLINFVRRIEGVRTG
jgi:hypothetical protein